VTVPRSGPPLPSAHRCLRGVEFEQWPRYARRPAVTRRANAR